MFAWFCSVFFLYSYYCELFCSEAAWRLCDCHCQGWVRYINTTKIRFGVCHCCYCQLIYDDSVIILCIIINSHRTVLFSQIPIFFIRGIVEPNCFAVDKEIHNLQFLIINNNYSNQVSIIRRSYQWKKGIYQGLDNDCEGYHDSDLICLSLVILGNTLLQPTSVSDWSGTERDVLSIAIVDLIPRSALVMFSLLCSSYY